MTLKINSIVFLLFGVTLASNMSAQHLYPFHDYCHTYTENRDLNYLIDLDKMYVDATTDAGTQDFKMHSKYKKRFTEDLFAYHDNLVRIYGEDEKTQIGRIQVNEKQNTETVHIGSKSWAIKLDDAFVHDCATLVIGDTIIISDYCVISDGASLSAYNIKSGTLLWKGDVIQKPIDHSKYHNHVILSLYKNKVIMEGIEASVSYVQVFDLHSGKRLFSTLQ